MREKEHIKVLWVNQPKVGEAWTESPCLPVRMERASAFGTPGRAAEEETSVWALVASPPKHHGVRGPEKAIQLLVVVLPGRSGSCAVLQFPALCP